MIVISSDETWSYSLSCCKHTSWKGRWSRFDECVFGNGMDVRYGQSLVITTIHFWFSFIHSSPNFFLHLITWIKISFTFEVISYTDISFHRGITIGTTSITHQAKDNDENTSTVLIKERDSERNGPQRLDLFISMSYSIGIQSPKRWCCNGNWFISVTISVGLCAFKCWM